MYEPGLLRSHRSRIIWSLSALFHLENVFKVHLCFPSSIYYLEWQDFLVLFWFFLQMNNIPLYTDCTISLSVDPSTDVCVHVLTTINATVNLGVQMSFRVSVFVSFE